MGRVERDRPATGRSAARNTSFFLNGAEFSFENPVSLVFAAANPCMSVARGVLLWIADEACRRV